MADMLMSDLSFDEDGSIYDDHGQVVPGSVAVLHNNLIKALREEYPAWADTWLIRIDTRGGIVQVYNTAFSGAMGFVMHIADIDPEMRKVRMMAGELFERYNIARKRAMDINQALADLEWNRLGEAKYED